MGRTFHCKFETFINICENRSEASVRALRSFDNINITDYDFGPLPDEESYIRMRRGDISAQEFESRVNVDILREIHQLPCITCTREFNLSDENKYANDVFMEDVFDPHQYIGSCFTGQIIGDFSLLDRTWSKHLRESELYSWATFLDRPQLPVSNSLFLVDRYIFQSWSGNENAYLSGGAENIISILQKTIPDEPCAEYRVLIVFDRSQLRDWGDLQFVINGIDHRIREKLDNKDCELTIEYLSIVDAKTSVNRKQHKLYSITHDRVLFSNFYSVTASHAFAAFNADRATWDQLLEFKALLSGMNNIDQSEDSLPINGFGEKVSEFIKRLSEVSSNDVECYRTTTEDQTPQMIDKGEICNRILSSVRNK